MTPRARYAAVLDVLQSIEATPRPADAIVSGYFRSRRYIGSKDRGAISALTYAVLRHHGRLNWWLAKLAQDLTPRGRLLIYLKLIEKLTTKELEDIFDGSQYAPSTLTALEHKLIRELKGHTLFHPHMPDPVAWECPDWAFDGLSKKFGSNLRRELEVLLLPAPLDLRINPLKTTREDALGHIKKLKLKVEKTPYSPLGLRVYERPALGQITLLKDGAIEIQDEGSQLVAYMVDPRPGERVVDFCAGAGGKTLAMSALMQNKGRIIACDVLENRLKRSGERFRRAGLHNIETHPLTSERDPWVKRHKASFDRVLVDAPCSGTGTWRRNPDARWRQLGPGIDTLTGLQTSILESASRLVKPGGRLVYATCSLLPDENEAQIERFLDNHSDFSLIPLTSCHSIFEQQKLNGPYLSLSPAANHTDGFFAAALLRAPSTPNP